MVVAGFQRATRKGKPSAQAHFKLAKASHVAKARVSERTTQGVEAGGRTTVATFANSLLQKHWRVWTRKVTLSDA